MTHKLAANENFDIVRGNQTVRVPFNTTDPAGATTNTLARQSDIPDISAKRDKTDLAVYRTVAVDEWSIADGRTDILPLTPLDISASPPIGDGEMATAAWVEGGGSISSSDRPPIAIWRIRFTPAGPDSTGDYFVVGVYNPMNHALMRVYSTLFTSGRDYISDPDPASGVPDELDFGTVDEPALGTVRMLWRFYKAGVPYPVPDVSLATTNAVVSKSSLAALSSETLSDMATQKDVKIMVQKILSVLQNAARCVALAFIVPALAIDADTAWEDVPPTNTVKSVVEQFSSPPDYATVSNRAMNAVTTNEHGTAQIFGSKYGLFLHPDVGQIEWEGPDVFAYIGLPKRSGTLALTDDIPPTNGWFRVTDQATLPNGSSYIYGTMWRDSFYSINLGFEFVADDCDYILPSPECPERSVYLASTNYVQQVVSTNNPAFVSAVLAVPIANADASDIAEIGEYGTYGTVGAAILALIAGLAALKRRMGAAETSVAAKLDASSAAPAFNSAAPYDVGNYVTHDGTLYRCTTAVATPGEWNDENWTVENMTSPDATLDVTSAGRLRLVDTDGTVLWQQGYDLAAESSATLSCDKVNLFVFAATTVPAFDDTATYDVDERVTYGGAIYKCTTAVETAGAWTGAANWTAEDPDTQAFTLPTAPSGKVGDLILDIDNSANTVAVEAKLTGFDEVENPTFSVVVQKGKNLTQMLTFAAGERAELYFTQTAFKVNNLPTWKLVKQVVENGGAQS